MRGRTVTLAIWTSALGITIGLAVFQRLTGPTYPKRGTLTVGSQAIRYRLLRSHGGEGGLPVRLHVGDTGLRGVLLWRRYPTQEDWRSVPLENEGGVLAGALPHQPPAGKVEYRILLESRSGDRHVIPDGEAVVARFKGSVPAVILVPHVLAMFSSMLFATCALLEAFRNEERARPLVVISMVLLTLGGLFLGPTVQSYAFGTFWTGWPFGEDFTDNKTIVAFLAWLPATIAAVRRRRLRKAVVLGWLVMMGVFVIPHSYRGSQIDWSKIAQPQ